MSRFASRATFTVALFSLSACTQPAAMVDMEGHKFFSKNGTQNIPYATYSPAAGGYKPNYAKASYNRPVVSHATTMAAKTDTVSVSDVAPPPAAVEVVDVKPVEVKSVEVKPVAAAPAPVQKAEVQEVNPWTKKPREAFIVAKNEKTDAPKTTKPVVLSTDRSAKGSFIWPVNGTKVISSYGPKGGGKVNDGMNIAATAGEPVWAAADGEVIYVGNELAGYGNMVLIKHAGDKTTTYAHLNHTTVDKYDRVAQGDIIGYVGQTGSVNKPQLHFAVRDGKDFVDPTKYVSRSLASN